ncbi:MAG: DEAD/DEAH box helicase [Candidatus Cloacimonetes bacterium]|nr:DEAD/DEAH box helicase [Candidatus Cloacimonadota bacterium]
MAKIFRKTFHEISSSWDFRQLSRKIDENSIEYEILRDQDDNYILSFSLSTANSSFNNVRFIYNVQDDELIHHDADLTNDIRKGYYYKYIEYAYNNITTNKLQTIQTTVFSKRVCKLNEYIQTQYQNIIFQIEGFYSIDEEVIKIYFKNLDPESFSRLVNYLSKLPEKITQHNLLQSIKDVDDIYGFFTIDELLFIKALFIEKRSVGIKNLYFSVNKESFVRLIPYIKNIQAKFSIMETGEKLKFADDTMSLNFYISQVDPYNFRLAVSESHTIHQFFVYLSTYLLINNTIHKVNLPFDDETVISIFESRYFFKKTELVYYKTIVGKQLSLFNNYLDFEENIDFPEISDDEPKVFFLINKKRKSPKPANKENAQESEDLSVSETTERKNEYGRDILSPRDKRGQGHFKALAIANREMQASNNESVTPKVDPSPLSIHAYFEYANGKKIPLTMALEKMNLFKLSFIESDRWYYLPDELVYTVSDFVTNHLFFNPTDINEFDWVVTKAQEIVYIKNNLFDLAHPSWNIVLSENLKKDFVKTINLIPEIEITSDDNIDWFSYKVVYKATNIELTQDMLRQFFSSGAKFLTAPDGSSVRIGNRDIFDEIESMLNLSQKDADYFHKMAIYRLPWIYELRKLNPAINIYGDKYLEDMYSALHKRALKDTLHPHYILKPIMRSYQKAGYEWLKMLENFKLNGILADEMGLGKTLQAISVLSDLPPDSKSLIICPKTLLFNWVAEIEKFNPQLKYIIYEGNKEVRTNLLKTVPVQIVICSYNLIQNDLDEFDKIYFDYMILDEAQHIKNHITLRAKAIKKIKARHKLAMTGTPLENSIVELWSMFDFLMPGYLPSLKKMKEYMVLPPQVYTKEGVAATKHENALDKIRQYIAPFILRRKKKDVLIELPDKQEQAIYCTMTEKQERYYIQVLEAVRNEVFGQKHDARRRESIVTLPQGVKSSSTLNKGIGTGAFNYITMLAALTRLRQICDHPGLINEEWLNDADISGKLNTLKEILVDAVENGRKLLIFSQYVKMLRLIEKMVKQLQIPYDYMDGGTKDRKNVINHFNNNDRVRLFLISLKTGGFGINLTAADTVILVDPWWNPMVENQAIDRVHRIGQTKKVLVYKMITKGSVEEKIMLLQKKKRDLFDNIIDQGDVVLKSLDNSDLRMLFEYKE